MNTSNQLVEKQPWSANEVIGEGNNWMERYLGWWYRLTVPPRAPANASLMRREIDRKARLLSTVVFCIVGIQILSIPISSPSGRIIILIGMLLTLGSLLANRVGKTTLTGAVIVITAEIGVMGIFLKSFTPLVPTVFQSYDMLLVVELIAVSLLPVGNVFVVATGNSIFIAAHILYAPRTQMAGEMLQSDLAGLLVRPIALQFFVAGIAAMWVYSAKKTAERANRAEMVATLEHVIAEQHAIVEHEKQELEESIQELVQAHTDAINGQVTARIAYPSSKVLWPLVGVVNSLWVRLQSVKQSEYDYEQLKQAISWYTQVLYQATFSSPQRLPMQRTGTELDPLMHTFKKVQESWYNVRDPMDRSRGLQ